MCALHGAAAAGPIIDTKEGQIEGLIKDGIAQFLGIPYAEPPVGDSRWRPPKTHAPWANVLKATSYAPICAQITTLGVFAGPANTNEDRLFLDVFTPDLNPWARLPVIFWMHGGGNYDGETPGYDGSKNGRARPHSGCDSRAYRLNLMGFLAHPALDNEGQLFANYSTPDQRLALKWVQRNIAMFGGDKNKLAIAGQSVARSNWH
jgi:para-nitrobenzyl esterase